MFRFIYIYKKVISLFISMSTEIDNTIKWLIHEEPTIFGAAIIGSGRQIVYQTENWDVSYHVNELNQLIADTTGKISSITLQGVKYMIVENTPERKIGTNVQGQGHLIICPVPPGGMAALICYINPQAGPRDALFNVQEYSKKLVNLI